MDCSQPQPPHLHFLAASFGCLFIASPSSLVPLHWLLTLQYRGGLYSGQHLRRVSLGHRGKIGSSQPDATKQGARIRIVSCYLPFCSTSILSVGRESERVAKGGKKEINMN